MPPVPVATPRAARIPPPAVDESPSKSFIEFVELTKQHKILLAVVGLGVGAVAVDRVILGSGISGPSQAAAATSEQPAPLAAPARAIETSHLSLADRIEELPAPEFTKSQVSDAFRPEAQTLANETQSSGRSTSSDAFRLSSVMTKPVPAAVVNGHMLRTDHDYAFAASQSGLWTLIKDEDIQSQRRNNPALIRVVRLESVQARTPTAPGSATIIIDGTERHQLVIHSSEK